WSLLPIRPRSAWPLISAWRRARSVRWQRHAPSPRPGRSAPATVRAHD
ncbi:MAG: hypothetical protein AVDCRST_MAG53-3091, partial [uncultured Solirubrobacteraceae bacterium]